MHLCLIRWFFLGCGCGYGREGLGHQQNPSPLSTKSERIKTQQQQAYREADRAVKQIIRHDKRKHLEDMATQAEEAAYKGDQRTLYKITKQVCGKFRSITTAPIKNKEGQLLTSETECISFQKNRRQYFLSVFSFVSLRFLLVSASSIFFFAVCPSCSILFLSFYLYISYSRFIFSSFLILSVFFILYSFIFLAILSYHFILRSPISQI